METPTHSTVPPGRASKSRGPLTLVLDLFSSVRLGITLLAILFVYATIGSAGVIYPVAPNIFSVENWRHSFVRTWRVFELTEFEWFHTTFFNALMGLIAANIIITTLRRIRLNALTAGVWMIHTGIVILIIGSVVYFARKVEGDTPVVRRQIRIEFPGVEGAPSTTMLAMPGLRTQVQTEAGLFKFQINSIDPRWPILSGADEGKEAYSVSVMVDGPTGRFIRQMLAGYPQYTEDVIPGQGRVKRIPEFGGRALVDEGLSLALEYAPRGHFWLMESNAIHVRRAGEREWSQRVVKGVPRYNDYLPEMDDMRRIGNAEPSMIRPLSIPVPPEPGVADALDGVDVRITGFLRYATEVQEQTPGGGSVNPFIEATLRTTSGASQEVELFALDPLRDSAGEGGYVFRWASTPDELEKLAGSRGRVLSITVPGSTRPTLIEVPPGPYQRPDVGFTEIEGTGYSARITGAADKLPLAGGQVVSTLFVEISTPMRTFKRWVFDQPGMDRDLTEGADPMHGAGNTEPDATIETRYLRSPLGIVTIVGGPPEVGLWALLYEDPGKPIKRVRLEMDRASNLTDAVTITPTRFIEDAITVSHPFIIPRNQRDKGIDRVQVASMVRVELSKGDWRSSQWLRFHRYSFEDDSYANAGLTAYSPAQFILPDGQRAEVIFSRERRDLPDWIALNDFILTEHVGGFDPSEGGTIRDWTSVLRFKPKQGDGSEGDWSDPQPVSTNKPTQHSGMWYFQSSWDPPRESGGVVSQGFNFTGLGVANRHGVYTQLAGCIIAVTGMIYAFYIKPIIRRRRRDRVLADIAAGRLGRQSDGGPDRNGTNAAVLAAEGGRS